MEIFVRKDINIAGREGPIPRRSAIARRPGIGLSHDKNQICFLRIIHNAVAAPFVQSLNDLRLGPFGVRLGFSTPAHAHAARSQIHSWPPVPGQELWTWKAWSR